MLLLHADQVYLLDFLASSEVLLRVSQSGTKLSVSLLLLHADQAYFISLLGGRFLCFLSFF